MSGFFGMVGQDVKPVEERLLAAKSKVGSRTREPRLSLSPTQEDWAKGAEERRSWFWDAVRRRFRFFESTARINESPPTKNNRRSHPYKGGSLESALETLNLRQGTASAVPQPPRINDSC
jgi:hypothetical protein